MLNAGVEAGGKLFSDAATWERIIGTNLWGVVNGIRAFAPAMAESGKPGAVIVSGSKQGITTPPGNAPYNVSKAGVKAVNRGARPRAAQPRGKPHQRPPAHPRLRLYRPRQGPGVAEKPAGAWTPDQTIAFMLERLAAGDFYIPARQRDHPRARTRSAWMGDGRHHRKPPGPLPLAPGLCRGVQAASGGVKHSRL